MKHYISPTGELFAYELDGSQDDLIPNDYTLATDAQVQAIQNPPVDPRIAIQAQIDMLESQQLLPRISREFMLLDFAQKAAAAGVDPTLNVAFVKLKAFDDQITALRDQLV